MEDKNIYIDFIKHIYEQRKAIKYIKEHIKCTCPKFILEVDGCACDRQVQISMKLDKIEEIMKSIDRFMQAKEIIIQKNN